LIGGAMVSGFTGAISQWANAGEWPDTLNWMLIIGGSVGAGLSALVAFCSGSVQTWRQIRNGGAPLDQPKP
jgi:hypothetical protein